jgi:hypothetical protein
MRVQLQLNRDQGKLLTRNASNTTRKILEREDVCASTLLVYGLDTFGIEMLEWDPWTLELEYKDTCGAELKDYQLDRLMAGISIVTSDDFFQSAARFIPLANVLSGDSFDPSVFDMADPEESSWAVVEALLLHPPEDNQPTSKAFSEEVKGYLGLMLREYGYMTPPRWLSFVTVPGSAAGDELAGDPEGASEFFANQESQSVSIDRMVNLRLVSLAEQLRGLQLTRGSTAQYAEHLTRQAQAILRDN